MAGPKAFSDQYPIKSRAEELRRRLYGQRSNPRPPARDSGFSHLINPPSSAHRGRPGFPGSIHWRADHFRGCRGSLI